MEHSGHYSKVALYYSTGVWSKKMVKNAVVKEWITPDEYKEIVGEDYAEG